MDLSFSWPVLGFQVLIDGPLFLWATQVLIDGPLILLAPFWLSRFWNGTWGIASLAESLGFARVSGVSACSTYNFWRIGFVTFGHLWTSFIMLYLVVQSCGTVLGALPLLLIYDDLWTSVFLGPFLAFKF